MWAIVMNEYIQVNEWNSPWKRLQTKEIFCCFEESHESKCVSYSMGKDWLESIFVPQRCVLLVSFVVARFCVLHALSLLEFLFSGFLLWVSAMGNIQLFVCYSLVWNANYLCGKRCLCQLVVWILFLTWFMQWCHAFTKVEMCDIIHDFT